MPLVEKYELNLRDHYRTDHAGLYSQSVLVQRQKQLHNPRYKRDHCRYRHQLSENEPAAENYRELIEGRLQGWNAATRQQEHS